MSRKRLWKWSGLLVLLTVASAATGWWALFHTEAGARWAWSKIQQATDGTVTASQPRGTLAAGFGVSDLVIEAGGAKARLNKVSGAISLRALPVRLVVRELLVDQADVTLGPADPGGAGSDLRLPLEVQLRRGLIRQLRLRSMAQDPLVEPLQLSVSGKAGRVLRIDDLTLRGASTTANLAGFAQLTAPFGHEFELDLKPPAAWTDGTGLIGRRFTIKAAGDVRATHVRLASEAGQLSADATIRNWLESPEWEARLGARDLSLPPALLDLDVRVDDLELFLQGSAERYSVQGRASLESPEAPGLELELAGSGSGGELHIDQARVSGNAFRFGLSGRVGWAGQPDVRLEADIDHFDPRMLLAQWPGQHPVSGSLQISWQPGSMALENLALAIAGQSSRLTGSAAWRKDTASAAARLQWQDLRWPPGHDAAILASREGSLELSGHLDQWRLEGNLALQSGTWPPGRFEVNGEGSRKRSSLRLTEGELLGGKVSGQASVDWQDRLTWQASLEASALQLADLWPEWPAVIDTELRMEGEAADLVLEIKRLQGRLRGEPLSGSGTVALGADGPRFEQLKLQSPGSHVEIQGSLAEQSGLEFAIEARRPGLAADLLGGEVSGTGSVRWTDGLPSIDLDLEARELEFGDLGIGQLSMRGAAGIQRAGATMSLEASRVAWGGSVLERLAVELMGTQQGHALTASASSGQNILNLSLAGQLEDWAQPANVRWAGRARQFQLLHQQREILAVTGAAALRLSRQGFGLDSACFTVAHSGELCIDSDWRPGETVSLQASLDGVPLALAEELTETDMRFSQTIDGNLEWSLQRGARPDGWADLSISPGTIEREGFEIESVATGEGRIGFRLENGQLGQGKLALPFPGLGSVDVELAIADLVLDGTGRLAGQARLDIEDLSLLEVFAPGIDRLSGQLSVNATLGGRVADPLLDGQLAVRDAAFDLPLLGLHDVRLDLLGTVSRNDQLSVAGTISSGEGAGRISARLDISDWDDPWFDIHLDGERLQLLDVPSLSALASPNFKLGWRSGQWSLAGELAVPQARFSPQGSVAERVVESDDLELIAGQPPLGVEPAGRRAAVPLSGTLLLRLGDQIRVDMPNVQMRATGDLQLVWNQALLPLTNGQILLDGEVRTFGPILRVDQGRIRYLDRPLDDPELNIRAERDVFGNTQIRTAGVRVGGSARQPTIEAYTNPLTTEERAWTLLVTGSDFEYGQGVGAFDIGTYIAPRLYVSYGISLFDDERQVGVRYDLRKGFGVKATSSQTDNGVDMSYTLER